MWQFLCGFGAGVYIGTYFECKPTIEQIVSFAKTKIPEKKMKLKMQKKRKRKFFFFLVEVNY